MDTDRLLQEMGRLFQDIAKWAVTADNFEIIIVNEELAKLATHLETMNIVRDSNKLEDLDA